MTLWILLGLFAIGLLGVACAWVLKARSGLEVESQIVLKHPSHLDLDAQVGAMHIEDARRGGRLAR